MDIQFWGNRLSTHRKPKKMIAYEYEPEILRTIDQPPDYLKSRYFTGNLPEKRGSGQESEKCIENDKELNRKTSH